MLTRLRPLVFLRTFVAAVVVDAKPRKSLGAGRLCAVRRYVSDFQRLDEIVFRAVKSLLGAAAALEAIRDRRLYRGEFQTFEAYCQERFDISRQYANKLIAAGRVRQEMETIVSKKKLALKLPDQEGVLRELGRLSDASDQVEVYQEAIAVASGENPTAAEVGKLVDEHPRGSSQKKQERGQAISASMRIQSALDCLDWYEAQILSGEMATETLISNLRLALKGNLSADLFETGLDADDPHGL